MLQKPLFKAFVWLMAITFFFLASAVVISMFKPGPTESEVMQFMMGMMGAMENSIMGITMGVESNADLQNILNQAGAITLPIIMVSILFGFLIRFMHRGDKRV